MTMATSSQVGLFSSNFFCSSAVQPKQTGASSRELACGPSVAARPQMKVICQKEEEVDVSRRFIAVAASATALGIFVQPEAQAARRKPPAPEEKKVEEDKGLSAYDARLLANARRKEAMKATLEAQKAKAGSVATTQ